MRTLLARSAVVAIFVGLILGFTNYAMSVHGFARFDPPISGDEGRHLRELPIAKAEAILATRQKTYTRGQWLAESIGRSYFWRDVAMNSALPTVAVFIACVSVGGLQMRDGGSR